MLLTKYLFALLFALLILTGCGGTSSPEATPAESAPPPTATSAPSATPTSAPTETPIPAPTIPTIIVGVNPAFAPFIFVEENRATGFDVDLLNAMATARNFEVAYVVSPFDEIFNGLEQGKFDAAISAITITDQRKQRVDFTKPYYTTGQASLSFFNPGQGLAVRVDDLTITSTASLTDAVVVGVKSGTTGAQFVGEETSAQLAVFPEAAPALEALTAGSVDAVVIDIPVIVDYIKTHPEASIKLVGGPVTEEEYGIAVRKDRSDLLQLLNEALVQVRADGSYDRIFQKWFAAP